MNKHIRSVCDGYAEDGFVVVSPAIFDRFERDVDLDYTPEGWKKAVELMGHLKPETTLLDVAAAYEYAKGTGKGIGVIGYCYGGLVGVAGRCSWRGLQDAAELLRGLLCRRDW